MKIRELLHSLRHANPEDDIDIAPVTFAGDDGLEFVTTYPIPVIHIDYDSETSTYVLLTPNPNHIVESRKITADTLDEQALEIAQWCGGSYNVDVDGDGSVEVPFEGETVPANDGDRIMKMVDGTFRVWREDFTV